MRPATLDVYANPYHAADHLGRPAGACPREVRGFGSQGKVGASAVTVGSTKLEKPDFRSHEQDTCWHFSPDVQKVEDTPYYRRAIRNGELLPASEAVAKAIGIEFLPRDKALRAAKESFIKSWRDSMGSDPPKIDPFCKPRAGVHPDDFGSAATAEPEKVA